MASECTQEAVVCFLTDRGGRVKNADLIDRFGSLISTDPVVFKSCVDGVAVVTVEHGEDYVCLRTRIEGSGGGEDDHRGPDSASVMGTSVEDGGSHDNPRDDCGASATPGDTRVPAKNKDAKQEIPLTGGGTYTPPDITQNNPDGSASRAFTSVASGCRDIPKMGNRHTDARAKSTGSVRGPDGTLHDAQAMTKSPPDRTLIDHLPTHTEAPDEERHPGVCATKTREDGTAGAGSESHDARAESETNAFKGSRKSFIAHMINSSPQVRRNMILRHKCDVDSPARAEDESAAATHEPLEHEWMMCACDGDWDSLRRLLDREPSLISKKDFVTGFTCLHWAAKLGKHELLARIVNFARQHRMTLDVNVRSSAGYTPLHLAAMHNHVEVIKLLVGACDADVEARDYNGKKASHYLREGVARDVLDITGADVTYKPEEHALEEETFRWRLPRVLQANLRLLNRSASDEDDRDCIGALTKDRPLHRKPSINKLKRKVRAGIAPIVHSTSHFERLEGATGQTSGPSISRPKSDLFG